MSFTDSILTEDYANKFHETIIPEAPTAGRFEFDDKDAYNVERKYQEILNKRRDRAATGVYQSVPYQTGTYNDHFRSNDDQSTVFDDYSMEIFQKKATIQKDLELERRDKSRMRSLSPTLPISGGGWKAEPLSPQETFEARLAGLDQLSGSVQKATQEHAQLCREMEDMRTQLRRHQAEVRLSERVEQRGLEATRELEEAERRRQKTVRQLELVTEELALKRVKLRSLDSQIAREKAEIRRLERAGIDKQEIETILAERDELYQLVRKQEDVQLEKYELAKQMDAMRGDFESEQDRAVRQIQALEDELEAGLRRMQKLQEERDTFEREVCHTRQHLSQAEEEMCKSAREVSELRDDYQARIRKKLEEYEQDKERVEMELKKMEEEKSLDQTNLKGHIEQIRNQLRNSDDERKELKEIVADLEEHLRKSSQSHNELAADQEAKISQMKRDNDKQIAGLKDSLQREYVAQLEEDKIRFGQEKNCLERQLDEEMDHLIRNIEMKEAEACQLQRQLRESEDKAQESLAAERSRAESHRRSEKTALEKKHGQEIAHIRKEEQQQAEQRARLEAERSREAINDKNIELQDTHKKLLDSQADNKRISSENMTRLRRIKDDFKDEIVKSLKTRYEQKMDEELVKVRSDFEKKLQKLQEEKQLYEQGEKRYRAFLHKIARTVVHEVNQECKKMAVLLNVQPRRVHCCREGDDFSRPDNVITRALANLEACGSETRSLVHELESKVRSQSEEMAGVESRTELDIRRVRQELEAEKNKDMAVIRDKLMKEHLREINKLAKAPDAGLRTILHEKEVELTRLRTERSSWKERAAEKIADKFDHINQKKMAELRQLLLRREAELRRTRSRQQQRSLSSRRVGGGGGKKQLQGGRIMSSLGLDPPAMAAPLQLGPVQLIGGLQQQLEQLRQENTDLRRLKLSSSNDLLHNHNHHHLDSRSRRGLAVAGSPSDSGLSMRMSRSVSRSRE